MERYLELNSECNDILWRKPRDESESTQTRKLWINLQPARRGIRYWLDELRQFYVRHKCGWTWFFALVRSHRLFSAVGECNQQRTCSGRMVGRLDKQALASWRSIKYPFYTLTLSWVSSHRLLNRTVKIETNTLHCRTAMNVDAAGDCMNYAHKTGLKLKTKKKHCHRIWETFLQPPNLQAPMDLRAPDAGPIKHCFSKAIDAEDSVSMAIGMTKFCAAARIGFYIAQKMISGSFYSRYIAV